jgi:predicted Fe-S protein YdhL (DUF1289 family)
MDPATNTCRGCLRTLDEIVRWMSMSPEEQWHVIDAVERRRAAREEHGTESE